MLEEKMVFLKKQLVEYALLVKKMVEKGVEGLLKKDRPLLYEVIEKDEPRANSMEMDLDEMGTTLIAQYAPKGKDLRTILMSLRMDNDFERIGDHAVNIAQSSNFLIGLLPAESLRLISKMSDCAVEMFDDSIASFIGADTEPLLKVCERDDIVDKLGNQILKESIEYMMADPSSIVKSLNMIRIAQNLERIADLSTNICEEIIYLSLGTVIKHHNIPGKVSQNG